MSTDPVGNVGDAGGRRTVERIIWWDGEMQACRYPSLAKCVERFEVSERTARRDITFLRDALNAPVEYDLRRRGYCYRGAGFSLPAMHLEKDELLALLVASRFLEQQGGPFHTNLESALAKIRRRLPDHHNLHLGSLQRLFSFDLGRPRAVNEDVFAALQRAVARRRQVRILYHGQGRGETTDRVVDPLHLHAARGEWYLVGFCHERDAIREFAVSRVLRLEELEARFVPPQDFDAEAWLGEPFGLFRGAEPEAVVLYFDPYAARWVRERTWHSSQTLAAQPDGGVVLRLLVPVAPDLVSWILSWGGGCRVLLPEFLHDAVQEQARRMLDSQVPGDLLLP